MSLWVIRTFFLLLCTAAGYAVSQYRPELIDGGRYGVAIGFGLGGLLIALDQMLKGFSLRAFSAATFGLLLGTLVAWLIERTQLFIYADEKTRWLIRLGLFLGFGYLGMILALRSNKEDFSLLIPYIRFRSQSKPENLIILDTSVIIDGRVTELIERRFVEGIIVIPNFVLQELQYIADSQESSRRARGRRGLDMLNRIRQCPRVEVRVHETEIPGETSVDARLLKLAQSLDAKLITYLNLNDLATALKPALLPGDIIQLKVTREGKDKGQGIGYLQDGTMVVINGGQSLVGQQAAVHVQSLHQTGAGTMVFGEVKRDEAA
jgi:uncharacterized protein YacL